MIYKKSANFPYPLLTNESTSYKDNTFLLDIELIDGNSDYIFNIKYFIGSKFINELIDKGIAKLILIVQARDNKFFYIDKDEKYKKIPKSRISLDKKTKLQLSIQLQEDINFKYNVDLNDFYFELKDNINIKKNSILGFSNVVTFDGSQTKPLTLFEKKIDKNLNSMIKIELGPETIIIHYKNEDLQFPESNLSNYLNYPYIYMGLQKALYNFINLYKREDDVIDISYISEEEYSGLNEKLYELMKNKHIEELSYENIDEVIDKISNKILEKYSSSIKELIKNGD